MVSLSWWLIIVLQNNLLFISAIQNYKVGLLKFSMNSMVGNFKPNVEKHEILITTLVYTTFSCEPKGLVSWFSSIEY